MIARIVIQSITYDCTARQCWPMISIKANKPSPPSLVVQALKLQTVFIHCDISSRSSCSRNRKGLPQSPISIY